MRWAGQEISNEAGDPAALPGLDQLHRLPFNWTVNPYRGCSHGCLCYPEVLGKERDAGTSPTSQGQAVCVVAISAQQRTTTGGLRIEHIPAPCPESRGSPRCATDDHGTNTRVDASHSSQSVGLKIRQAAHHDVSGSNNAWHACALTRQ